MYLKSGEEVEYSIRFARRSGKPQEKEESVFEEVGTGGGKGLRGSPTVIERN